jgi:CubicO group peptidase (beta-lactamase class C family)
MEKWYEANAANLLMTTIEDYCKFGVSVIKRKGIAKKVYEEMITPQAPKGKSIYWPGGKNVSYGLCWGLIKNLNSDGYALFHKGRNPGLNTILVLFPKSQRGIVILTNGENGSELHKEIISESLYLATDFLARLISIL